MSLKHFHIVFIIASMILSFLLAYWALHEYMAAKNTLILLLTLGSLASGLALGFYLIWFLKKINAGTP